MRYKSSNTLGMLLMSLLRPRPCSCLIFLFLLPFSVVAADEVSVVVLVVEGDSVAVGS